MRQIVTTYGSVLAVFLVLDGLWLGVIAGPYYRSELAGLLKPEFNVAVALAFYLFYAAGLVFFAVQPAIASGSIWTALFYGAFLGALAYGTYDLTNLATLQGYPVTIAVLDLGWGIVVSASAAAGGYLISRRLELLFG
ncbi:DUF2177 family protein [Chthonobacter albigriseus]|uniref:DUF2177 family protein n=1 Tax=Chthonobacter albigriseus TaxID=1683161 RepID=UPI0015EED018|nr:DUF2177 family protein [Chthonobacter albigriseus]